MLLGSRRLRVRRCSNALLVLCGVTSVTLSSCEARENPRFVDLPTYDAVGKRLDYTVSQVTLLDQTPSTEFVLSRQPREGFAASGPRLYFPKSRLGL